MKKFTTLALAGLVATSVFGQQPQKQKFVASPDQINAKAENIKNNMLFHDVSAPSIVRANVLPAQPMVAPNGKVAAVSPIALGSAGNAFTCLRGEQNQVFLDNDLDVAGFIHRNNPSIYGGSSGEIRYDVSIDGGSSFTNDVGVLNPGMSNNLPSRYPNVSLFNPAGNTNPNDAWVVSATPTLGSPTWDGIFAGLAPLTTGTQSGQMEHYLFQGTQTLLPGGLCEGMEGEFWMVDAEYDGTNQTGAIPVYKGVIAAGDITWSVMNTLNPNHDISIDGTVTMVGPNLSFSPDGSVGWVAWCGDLVGGQDSLLSPCFSKTTDNGVTWSTPVEMDLNSIAWVADSLQTLWIDSTGAPASNGVATCAFDYDLIVDGDGNPHMAVVIGTASSGTPYSISSGLAKFMADVYSPDGGATWDIAYISPVLAFRTPAYGASASTVSMDNNCQIARSEDGNHIFYAWSDSDTSLVTGNQNGIGFGQSTNSAPNLRIAGMNVITGEQTYPQLITDGDLLWEGRALFPMMSPVVKTGANNCWNLPIVMAEMPALEPIDPTNFHYFGNDATVCAAGFCDPGQMSLSWDQFAFNGATPPCFVGIKDNVQSNVILGNAYPNPTANNAVITFEVPAVSNIVIDVMNVYGQQVAVLANGEFNAGAHKVVLNTEKLASGVYFYNLRTNDAVISKKLVVSK